MSANIHEKFLTTPLEKRIRHSSALLRKNQGRIPLLLHLNQPATITLQKTKFLLDRSMKVREFIHKIRKRANVSKDLGIFFYVKKRLLNPQDEFGQVYDKLAHEDGFLYLTVSEMATSG